MPTGAELLQRLQRNISEMSDSTDSAELTERVYFAEIHDLFHVEFYGSPFDDAYDLLHQTMCAAEV